jgi:hypothetical protein
MWGKCHRNIRRRQGDGKGGIQPGRPGTPIGIPLIKQRAVAPRAIIRTWQGVLISDARRQRLVDEHHMTNYFVGQGSPLIEAQQQAIARVG